VGHGDDRPSVLLGEPGGDPGGEIVIGFAVGGAEIPFVAAVAVENSLGSRYFGSSSTPKSKYTKSL
jgi:hypothetical protein